MPELRSTKRTTAGALFVGDRVSPLLIKRVLDDLIVGWATWDVAALRIEIEELLGITLSSGTWSRIAGLIALLSSDRFFTDWEVFSPVCLALNGDTPDFESADPPDVPQMTYAVALARALYGDRMPEFSEEVKIFIAEAAKENGCALLPDILAFSRRFVTPLMFRCKTCGTVGVVERPDQMCPSCLGIYRDSTPFSKRSLSDLMEVASRQNVGLVEPRLPVEPVPVSSRMEDPTSVSEVQTARLALAQLYEESCRQLDEQQLREYDHAIT